MSIQGLKRLCCNAFNSVRLSQLKRRLGAAEIEGLYYSFCWRLIAIVRILACGHDLLTVKPIACRLVKVGNGKTL